MTHPARTLLSRRDIWRGSALGVAAATVPGIVAATPAAAATSATRPYVVLSWDDTGDFGPQTTGTTTAGWQEAIDHALATQQNLYVKGGGAHAVYFIFDTIRIPPTKQFHVFGDRQYVVNWSGDPNKDLMTIDSAFNCAFSLGILVYGGLGAGVRIKPQNPAPVDNITAVTESSFYFEDVVDPHPFSPGTEPIGDGVVFDASAAPIISNEFGFHGVVNFSTNIKVVGAFLSNKLYVLDLHTNRTDSTMLATSELTINNTIEVIALRADQGATGVTAVLVAGNNNTYVLKDRAPDPFNSYFAPGRTIVLAASAAGSSISYTPYGTDVDVLSRITDGATSPTNQVTWNGPPPPANSLRINTRHFVHTQRLFPAMVRLAKAGGATVSVTRGATTLPWSTPGSATEVVLSVGDSIRVDRATGTTLQVLPIKV